MALKKYSVNIFNSLKKRCSDQMTLKKIKILTSISLVLTVCGCSFSDDALFPSLSGNDVENRSDQKTISSADINTPPSMGSTEFEPIEVTSASDTGTFVGQKVTTFRGELKQLQDTIRKRNQTLQAIRSKTSVDAAKYHSVVALIKSRLQVGTTPGNPDIFARWQDAQSMIQRMNENISMMNQLATQVASDSAMTAYLSDSIRAAFNVSGAVDEDHRQLRILEDETNQTAVLIERLLSELNHDINRQQQYTENEKSNLSTLTIAIKDGQLYGSSLSSPTASFEGTSPNYSPLPDANVKSKPLFIVRFNKPNVPYEQGLYQSIKRVLEVKKDAKFELVAVTPIDKTKVSNINARRSAESVLRSLTSMGMPASRVNLSAMSSDSADSVEVHLYVK